MGERRALRRQSADYHFGSLMVLAITAGAVLVVAWVATKALFVFLQESPIPWVVDWQRHVLASSGYLELGMLNDAGLALEEIEPEVKTRTEVLGARVSLYISLLRNGTWPLRSPSSRKG